jgi:GAF domain-containing protein
VEINERSRLLSAALVELASTADTVDVMEMVHLGCDKARAVCDADGAVVMLSIDGHALDVAGQSGFVGDPSACTEPPEQPCVDVITSGESQTFRAGDVDGRYPRYANALREMGIARTLSVPLHHRSTVVGTLVLVRTDDIEFDAGTCGDAQLLADAIAINLVREQTLRAALAVTAQLEHALHARVVVEQAKGLVAGELQVSIDDALECLRQFARRQHLRLADVADDVVSRKLPTLLLTA